MEIIERERWAWILVAVALVDSLVTAGCGFRFGFTHDDLMNTHWGLTRSWTALLTDILAIWRVSPIYRPTGVTLLKGIHDIAGMNILLWRWIYGALLVSMTAVTIILGTRLSGRLLVGSLAGVLMGFHAGLRPLYFGMGFIYDVLAYTLGGLTMLAYLRGRSGDWRWGLTTMLLLCLTLEAKEVGVAAVAFIGLYEVLLTPPRPLRSKLFWAVVLAGLIFSVGRIVDPNSVANQFASYKVHASPTIYLMRIGIWTKDLLRLQDDSEAAAFANGCWTLAAAVVLLVIFYRHRLGQWGVLSYLTGVLPVAFIPQRGLEAVALPLLPLAVASGLLLVVVIDRLPGSLLRAVAVMGIAGIALYYQGKPDERVASSKFREVDNVIMTALADLPHLSPQPRPSDHFLIESDPFEEMDWGSCFLFRLYSDLPFLDVRRTGKVTPAELVSTPWRRITWNNGHWQEHTQSAVSP